MTTETSKAAKLGALQQFAASLAANSADLPQLEQSRLQFEGLLARLYEIVKQQSALVASKQEASKQLDTLMTECQRLASVLRAAVKQHYGIRAEKLAEFNLQPFRGRNRNPKPSPVELKPSPVEPKSTPSDPNQ
ncbi:MAG TPA: hypothetical protein VEW48_04845 [Thermoanaerobaculia bacterium]|nr:hypothetical protein [Thermoanaerobaculia bacterium]